MRTLMSVALTLTILACGGDSLLSSAPGTIQQPTTPTPTSVVIQAPGQSATVGVKLKFSATVYDGSNNAMPNATVSWLSSNPAVATIDANGLATTIAGGTTIITVTVQSKPSVTGTALLTVVPAAPAPTLDGGTIYAGMQRAPFVGTPATDVIIAVDPNTLVEKNLTGNLSDDRYPSVSPDGQYILLQSQRFVPYGESVIMKKDGTGVQRLYTDCRFNDGLSLGFDYCARPQRWLSNSRLLFAIDDAAAVSFSIHDPVAQTNSAVATVGGLPEGVAFSPTGDIIVGYYNNTTALAAERVSDGTITMLAPACLVPSSCVSAFSWSPSGMALYAARDGAIVRIALDGSGSQELYRATIGALGEAEVSPDGNYVAFMEDTDVRLLRVDGSRPVQTLHTLAYGNVAWSPNSKSIAFATNSTGLGGFAFGDQVTAINVDGTAKRSFATTSPRLQGITWGK